MQTLYYQVHFIAKSLLIVAQIPQGLNGAGCSWHLVTPFLGYCFPSEWSHLFPQLQQCFFSKTIASFVETSSIRSQPICRVFSISKLILHIPNAPNASARIESQPSLLSLYRCPSLILRIANFRALARPLRFL